MTGAVEPPATGRVYSDEDWYGEDLSGRTFIGCRFEDCDLTEVVSTSATFEECEFVRCRLNASTHRHTVLARCVFRRTSLFSARLHDCRLVGSTFDTCTLRPLTVTGGDWSFVSLSGAKLAGVDLAGVRLEEADLSAADLTDVVLRGARLSRALLSGARLTRADLRRADLSGVDLTDLRWDKTTLDPQQALLVAAGLGIVVDD